VQWALHWKSPWVKYYKFQISLTHFCFTTSKECSGQISQKCAKFWYPINSFVCRNDSWSFSRSFLQFCLVEFKKLAIHIFFRNLHLLSFPMIYSLPCLNAREIIVLAWEHKIAFVCVSLTLNAWDLRALDNVWLFFVLAQTDKKEITRVSLELSFSF